MSHSAPYSGFPLSVPGIQTVIFCTGVQGVKRGEMPLFIAIKARKVPLVLPTTWIKRQPCRQVFCEWGLSGWGGLAVSLSSAPRSGAEGEVGRHVQGAGASWGETEAPPPGGCVQADGVGSYRGHWRERDRGPPPQVSKGPPSAFSPADLKVKGAGAATVGLLLRGSDTPLTPWAPERGPART